MISLKAQFIYFLLRNRHLLDGKFKKETYDFNTSIQGFRDKCERGAARYARIPEGIEIKAEEIAGMKTEWIIPQSSDPSKVIMYVHGGGYVSGSCADHRAFVSKFANSCGYTNLVYEYRLAPEFPFPAAVDDSVTIYKKLLEKGYKPADIIIAGESAGGGLALALLLALKDYNVALPAAGVAISPWTNLTCSGESYHTKNEVSLAPMNSWLVFSKHYAMNNDLTNPLISPLFGDLKGLPPIFINSGTDDELHDDGEKFYKKALEQGVDITFRSGIQMVHCYPLFSPAFKEAKDAMDEICSFITKHFNKH